MSDTEHSAFEEDNYNSKHSDVYLALVDTPVKVDDELNIEDTFIGGEPLWLDENSIPSEELLTCGSCKKKDNFKLLLQAFSPLDVDQVSDIQTKLGLKEISSVNPDDDRVLYVFICTKCQRKPNSIRCIRGVKKNVPQTDNTFSAKLDAVSEGKDFKINPFDLKKTEDSNPLENNKKEESNPFGSNPFNSQNSDNPFNSFKKNSEGEEQQKTPEKSAKAIQKAAQSEHDSKEDKQYDESKAFKNYLLYVEEESFKNKKPDHLKLPKNLKIDKEALDLTGTDEEDLTKNPIKVDPRTEKLSKFLDDDTFQKFQEIVAYNPHQVLRYDLGGKPLLYADTKVDLVSTIPNPSFNPSSKRVFEMQLMPKMIMDLEDTTSIKGGMEWGTILIFTDIQNYIPNYDDNDVGYVEECVRVQWES
ncbi:hypothetical protein RNJ44_01534 [Nakaseomyces bracarensis]|uniref:Programmed cell death protein 2 C-terminal domain-containing protein n=1 Tax=Nakaseomyces bracarensis TaxID=273131 RepID=A0ABR4NQ81_9SACH